MTKWKDYQGVDIPILCNRCGTTFKSDISLSSVSRGAESGSAVLARRSPPGINTPCPVCQNTPDTSAFQMSQSILTEFRTSEASAEDIQKLISILRRVLDTKPRAEEVGLAV